MGKGDEEKRGKEPVSEQEYRDWFYEFETVLAQSLDATVDFLGGGNDSRRFQRVELSDPEKSGELTATINPRFGLKREIGRADEAYENYYKAVKKGGLFVTGFDSKKPTRISRRSIGW